MADQSDIVSVVQKRIKYIQLMEKCGSPVASDNHHKNLNNATVGILALIKGTRKASLDDAMLVKDVLETALSPAQVETIMTSLHQKVNLASSAGSGEANKADKQEQKFLDRYLIEDDWQLFQDPQKDINSKLFRMATLFVKMGLLKPTEKTFALGVVLATAVHGLDVNEMYLHTCKLMQLTRSILAQCASEQGPSFYPEEVS